jgi:hypothetical protein
VLANKIVVIIDADAPIGIALNAAALVGVAVGSHVPDMVGPEAQDAAGNPHPGMCAHPIPVLKADTARLTQLRDAAATHPEVTVHDVNQVARTSRTYDQYQATMAGTKPEDLNYTALAIHGPRQAVDSLTGALPLYR